MTREISSLLLPFQYAIVIREGEKQNVQAEELCLGDIIDVKFGDRIPADVRVIEARGFKVMQNFLMEETITCWTNNYIFNFVLLSRAYFMVTTGLELHVIISRS